MEWIEDAESSVGELIKLKVGESIEGILLEKYKSDQWENRYIYKIRTLKNDEIKTITGTTLLDAMMKDKEPGKPIKIQRIEDTPSGKEHPYHNFKVYTSKEEDKKSD